MRQKILFGTTGPIKPTEKISNLGFDPILPFLPSLHFSTIILTYSCLSSENVYFL